MSREVKVYIARFGGERPRCEYIILEVHESIWKVLAKFFHDQEVHEVKFLGHGALFGKKSDA